jgi:hypothetical protein
MRAGAPFRRYLGIRAPLQAACPRNGFVSRQGRPEARKASAGAEKDLAAYETGTDATGG